MKKIGLVLCFVLCAIVANGQILDPVKWSTNVNKISDGEYELEAIAEIEEGWHLYSQSVPEDGPIPTSFVFKGSSEYLKKGNTKEEEGHTVDDPIFDMRITYFDTKASFKQRIKLREKAPFSVKAVVEFMVCDDSRCLPPKEVDLVFSVN